MALLEIMGRRVVIIHWLFCPKFASFMITRITEDHSFPGKISGVAGWFQCVHAHIEGDFSIVFHCLGIAHVQPDLGSWRQEAGA